MTRGAAGVFSLAALGLWRVALEVLVPMAGLIDKDAELARLDKEIQRLNGEVARVGGKLSNAAFVDKAPAEVIEKERTKLAEAEQALSKLAEQHARISSL